MSNTISVAACAKWDRQPDLILPVARLSSTCVRGIVKHSRSFFLSFILSFFLSFLLSLFHAIPVFPAAGFQELNTRRE